MAARLSGYDGDRAILLRRGRRVHPHRDARPRRHHRRLGPAARPPGRALAVGQRHHGAARRLPLHQVDGAGAHARHARHRPAAVRRHAADDRRRAVPADQERRRRHHRGRALRHHPPQDGVPVRRLRADRRHARRASRTERGQALREYGFNLGIAFQLVDDLLDFTGDAAGGRQADRQRPARRQGDAAADPPAAPASRTAPAAGSSATSSRREPSRGSSGTTCCAA